MGRIEIVNNDDVSILTISDQQWLDHANQNNAEFANRQILLKGDGPPSNVNDPAPFGSFYKNNLTGDRYEQRELDPNTNGYDWQLFQTGGAAPGEADRLIEDRPCDSSLAAGDLVHESTTVAGGVDKVVNNTDGRLVIGICMAKPSATVASIMFIGAYTGISGFNTGAKVYCSPTGTLTYTLPTTGYVQVLGNTSDGSHMDFRPIMLQTLRA